MPRGARTCWSRGASRSPVWGVQESAGGEGGLVHCEEEAVRCGNESLSRGRFLIVLASVRSIIVFSLALNTPATEVDKSPDNKKKLLARIAAAMPLAPTALLHLAGARDLPAKRAGARARESELTQARSRAPVAPVSESHSQPEAASSHACFPSPSLSLPSLCVARIIIMPVTAALMMMFADTETRLPQPDPEAHQQVCIIIS
eukprot:1929470-Rhodomonas_salina.1